MSTILSTVYSKIHGNNKQAYQNYWASVRYTGYLLDEITVIESGRQLKASMISNVRDSLEGEYKDLDPFYVDTVVATTMYDSGFLLTPLEALERLDTLFDKLGNYRLLATHVSPLSIKERLRRVLDTTKPGITLSDYVVSLSIDKLLPAGTTDLKPRIEKLEMTHPSDYILSLYNSYIPLVYEYIKKGYNRKLIYQIIRSNYYLHLKSNKSKGKVQGKLIEFDRTDWSKEEILKVLDLLKRETTYNYYEPLVLTRVDGIYDLLKGHDRATALKLADIGNIAFLEYADVYSKVVRIANIRRRLLVQDVRYLITEGVSSAYRHMYKELEQVST